MSSDRIDLDQVLVVRDVDEAELAAVIDDRSAHGDGVWAYRFAHIDGRIASNPAQYVRRPKVHPSQGQGMDRTELGRFLFTAEHFGHHAPRSRSSSG
jgi:hypothetical protein